MRIVYALVSTLFVLSALNAADSTSVGKPVPTQTAPAAEPSTVAAPLQEDKTVQTAPAAAMESATPATQPAVAIEAAPAKEKSPEPLPVKPSGTCPIKKCSAACAAKSCAPLITWYGMARLSLRDEIVNNFLSTYSTTQHVEKSNTFSFPLGYKIGLIAKPNDQVLIQAELGNDWYESDVPQGIPGNYYTQRTLPIWFSLAYVQWDPGYMHILAGIIPVKGTPLMDLLGVSILFNKSYKMASQVPWGAVTNLGQTGLKIGVPICKNDFKLGLDFSSMIIQQRPAGLGIDSMTYNANAIEFLGEIPLSYNGFCAVPQVFAIPNRSYNSTTGKSDMEFGVGSNFGCKATEKINLRAGFGYAANSNAKSFRAGDSVLADPFDASKGKVLDKPFDRSGYNIDLGISWKLCCGTLNFDYVYSSEKDNKDSTVDDEYPFVDLKYCAAINKNFSISPRLRVYMEYPKVVYDSKFTVRPEIIFNGSF